MTIKLNVFETVYQTNDVNGFTYRITVAADKCVIKRTPTKDMLWSHGIICEVYQTDSKQFEQMCRTSFTETNVGDLTTALRIIEKA